MEIYEPKKDKPNADVEKESQAGELESEIREEAESTETEGDTYQLARDGKRRAIKAPKRYAVTKLIAYALTAGHEINDEEPWIYQEVISGKHKQ